MKKGHIYIIIGSGVILASTVLYFWRRGKAKSNIEKNK
tara:strand:+ start:423 stop:536 length:114 start_codon:yes stop_codon:yes gene_type:complete